MKSRTNLARITRCGCGAEQSTCETQIETLFEAEEL